MGMTLKRLERTEVLNQLKYIRDNAPGGESRVISLNRHGVTSAIVKVEDTGGGVFLVPFEPDSPVIRMAPLVGSDMHDYGLDELISALEKCVSEPVWLQWPSDRPHTAVGKVLGVSVGSVLTVDLVPVPHDIDRVNREVHAIVSARCADARGGLECGDCPKLASCGIIRDADIEITKREEAKP